MFNVWRASRRQLSCPSILSGHFMMMMMKWQPAFKKMFCCKKAGRHLSFLKKAGCHKKWAGRRAMLKRPRQNTDFMLLLLGHRWLASAMRCATSTCHAKPLAFGGNMKTRATSQENNFEYRSLAVPFLSFLYFHSWPVNNRPRPYCRRSLYRVYFPSTGIGIGLICASGV